MAQDDEKPMVGPSTSNTTDAGGETHELANQTNPHSSPNTAGTEAQSPSSTPATGDRRTRSLPNANAVNAAAHDDKGRPPVPPITHHASDQQRPSAANAANPSTTSGGSGHGGRKKVRQSEEFDRRYDGPFGRPSLHYARRQSAQLQRDESKRTTSLPNIDAPSGAAATADSQKATTAAAGLRQDPEAAMAAAPPPIELEPPRLGYTIRTRKRIWFIAIFWTIIVFDSVVMPIGLYFGLWYGVGPGNPDDERLSANTVFSIVTAAIGGASILEYFVRFWRLYRKDSTCAVLGAHRWYLDWFHWWFSFGWIVVMIELIIGSIQDDARYIRLLSMPLATMCFVFGTILLIMDTMHFFAIPAPVRISSIPKGSQLRPGIYPLIEDICAVDGSGGTEFRAALAKRYAASHVFRAMLRRLGFFWAVGSEGCAVLTTALVFGLHNHDYGYAIGWSLPFVWAGIWAVATIFYVQHELKKEERLWSEEVCKGRNEGSLSTSAI
ncbi:hypothetical protein PG999_013024 [Apiospora kogelbergensis]|uniref:Uncharacterized protein n=1 Tax=Apiospora kogelbergensis TaxID=1337665 RepID=A0AAW0QA56_9PEZI